MARTVNVNFRMDSELKKDMEQVCMDMGLSDCRFHYLR